MPSEIVRVFQTHDAAGNPVAAEFAQVIAHQGLRSIAETTLEIFGGYNLRATTESGSYLYTDPSRGSGWLRLENFVDSDVATLDNLVRTAEISRSIGSVDPARQEELPLGGAVVNRTSNPYFQIGLGIGAIVLGIACAIFPLAGLSSSGAAANVVLVIVALALIGVGIWVAIHGARRRSWWVAARAEARRTGQPLPDQLKVWN